eukprot:s462_g20.t2
MVGIIGAILRSFTAKDSHADQANIQPKWVVTHVQGQPLPTEFHDAMMRIFEVVAFEPFDILQAIKSDVFPEVLPFLEEKRVLFADGLDHKLLPREGLEDVLASPIVPFDDVAEGDRLEVIVNGSEDIRRSSTWEPCVVLAHNLQTGMLDLELTAPSPRAGEHVRQSWGLARRYPWRYVTVEENDTILVGTVSGWQPAKVLSKAPEDDTLDLAFPSGAQLQSVRPRFRRMQDQATRFDQGDSYSDVAEGERIKVDTSRGWEIASVAKKHEGNKSLDIEMFPDGERFLNCKPLIRTPKTKANETALALWAENQRLRRRLAILSSLKAIFTSTALAKVAWYIARHHIEEYVQEYKHNGIPSDPDLRENMRLWELS